MQPVRPAARFGSHSESASPTAAMHSASRELAGKEAGSRRCSNERVAGNLEGRSMIMAC